MKNITLMLFLLLCISCTKVESRGVIQGKYYVPSTPLPIQIDKTIIYTFTSEEYHLVIKDETGQHNIMVDSKKYYDSEVGETINFTYLK